MFEQELEHSLRDHVAHLNSVYFTLHQRHGFDALQLPDGELVQLAQFKGPGIVLLTLVRSSLPLDENGSNGNVANFYDNVMMAQQQRVAIASPLLFSHTQQQQQQQSHPAQRRNRLQVCWLALAAQQPPPSSIPFTQSFIHSFAATESSIDGQCQHQWHSVATAIIIGIVPQPSQATTTTATAPQL